MLKDNILDKFLKYLSITALCTMISLVFLNVILRYFFHSGIPWSEEFARVCFVYVIFCGIVIAARSKSHLFVDIVVSNVPPHIKVVLNLITEVIIIFIMFFVVKGSIGLIELTYDQRMPSTQISSAWLYIASGTAAFLYICITILNIIQILKSFRKGAK